MRASWWIGIWATFLSSTVRSVDTAPFAAPEQAEANKRAFEVLQLLRRSDNNCPSGYSPCTSLGKSDACCKKGTNCSRDAADNVACCPTGASCTGSLTASATGGSYTGSSFMFPQDATASTTAPSVTGSPGSTLSGAYPFVYVPTTFTDASTCSSYYSRCQSDYSQCTGALMGRYGVTVGGNGGAGTTVEAITATSQATSICSSLSVEACHGLGLGYCGTVKTGTAHEASGNAAVPRRASSLHDLVLGLAVGVAGMFV